MSDYGETLEAEAASWVLEDSKAQREKLRRERIRHFRLARDLKLDVLGTTEMDVLEVGGGPLPLSDILSFRSRVVVDPLSDTYRKIAPCRDHVAMKAEDMVFDSEFDLVIATNSLDHVDVPETAVTRITEALRPSGYAAILCAENNAITNKHPAHRHNLTDKVILKWMSPTFETVWSLTFREHGFRYGWVEYEGRRGQPAFALLLRKCTGY